MHETFVTDNLLAITAVYQYGCWYLKITHHGNLSFVDVVSDSDTYGSFISNFRFYGFIKKYGFIIKLSLHKVTLTWSVIFVTLILEFNNFAFISITITTLAAHAVIREGLINMCWFRELLYIYIFLLALLCVCLELYGSLGDSTIFRHYGFTMSIGS